MALQHVMRRVIALLRNNVILARTLSREIESTTTPGQLLQSKVIKSYLELIAGRLAIAAPMSFLSRNGENGLRSRSMRIIQNETCRTTKEVGQGNRRFHDRAECANFNCTGLRRWSACGGLRCWFLHRWA